VASKIEGNVEDNPSITPTANSVAITAVNRGGDLDYWWQQFGTAPWHKEQVAAG
jgi:hypothetical protein